MDVVQAIKGAKSDQDKKSLIEALNKMYEIHTTQDTGQRDKLASNFSQTASILTSMDKIEDVVSHVNMPKSFLTKLMHESDALFNKILQQHKYMKSLRETFDNSVKYHTLFDLASDMSDIIAIKDYLQFSDAVELTRYLEMTQLALTRHRQLVDQQAQYPNIISELAKHMLLQRDVLSATFDSYSWTLSRVHVAHLVLPRKEASRLPEDPRADAGTTADAPPLLEQISPAYVKRSLQDVCKYLSELPDRIAGCSQDAAGPAPSLAALRTEFSEQPLILRVLHYILVVPYMSLYVADQPKCLVGDAPSPLLKMPRLSLSDLKKDIPLPEKDVAVVDWGVKLRHDGVLLKLAGNPTAVASEMLKVNVYLMLTQMTFVGALKGIVPERFHTARSRCENWCSFLRWCPEDTDASPALLKTDEAREYFVTLEAFNTYSENLEAKQSSSNTRFLYVRLGKGAQLLASESIGHEEFTASQLFSTSSSDESIRGQKMAVQVVHSIFCETSLPLAVRAACNSAVLRFFSNVKYAINGLKHLAPICNDPTILFSLVSCIFSLLSQFIVDEYNCLLRVSRAMILAVQVAKYCICEVSAIPLLASSPSLFEQLKTTVRSMERALLKSFYGSAASVFRALGSLYFVQGTASLGHDLLTDASPDLSAPAGNYSLLEVATGTPLVDINAVHDYSTIKAMHDLFVYHVSLQAQKADGGSSSDLAKQFVITCVTIATEYCMLIVLSIICFPADALQVPDLGRPNHGVSVSEDIVSALLGRVAGSEDSRAVLEQINNLLRSFVDATRFTFWLNQFNVNLEQSLCRRTGYIDIDIDIDAAPGSSAGPAPAPAQAPRPDRPQLATQELYEQTKYKRFCKFIAFDSRFVDKVCSNYTTDTITGAIDDLSAFSKKLLPIFFGKYSFLWVQSTLSTGGAGSAGGRDGVPGPPLPVAHVGPDVVGTLCAAYQDFYADTPLGMLHRVLQHAVLSPSSLFNKVVGVAKVNVDIPLYTSGLLDDVLTAEELGRLTDIDVGPLLNALQAGSVSIGVGLPGKGLSLATEIAATDTCGVTLRTMRIIGTVAAELLDHLSVMYSDKLTRNISAVMLRIKSTKTVCIRGETFALCTRRLGELLERQLALMEDMIRTEGVAQSSLLLDAADDGSEPTQESIRTTIMQASRSHYDDHMKSGRGATEKSIILGPPMASGCAGGGGSGTSGGKYTFADHITSKVVESSVLALDSLVHIILSAASTWRSILVGNLGLPMIALITNKIHFLLLHDVSFKSLTSLQVFLLGIFREFLLNYLFVCTADRGGREDRASRASRRPAGAPLREALTRRYGTLLGNSVGTLHHCLEYLDHRLGAFIKALLQ